MIVKNHFNELVDMDHIERTWHEAQELYTIKSSLINGQTEYWDYYSFMEHNPDYVWSDE